MSKCAYLSPQQDCPSKHLKTPTWAVLQEKPAVDEDRRQHCPDRLLMRADGNRATWVAIIHCKSKLV